LLTQCCSTGWHTENLYGKAERLTVGEWISKAV
jgi:hypothetical protein